MRRFRLLYMAAAALLGVVFFALMKAPMLWATLEMDLWWMLPTLSSLLEGKPGLGIAAFVLAPSPRALEPPFVKAFLLLATPVVGLQIKHLVFMGLVLHCATALLLCRVVRQLGLGTRSSFFSACFYFTLSANFHAFLWPVAFQHLLAVFTILLVLHLYLRTEERMRVNGGRLPWIYGATLLAGLMASLQRGALIVLGLILTDLLARPREHAQRPALAEAPPRASAQRLALVEAPPRAPAQRVALYRRWLPLFVIGLLYPAWILAIAYDGIVTGVVIHSLLPARMKDFLLAEGRTLTPLVLSLKYSLLLAAGMGGLAGVGALLRASARWRKGGNALRLAIGLLLGWVALFGLQDKRQLFFPYNAAVPFVTALASFLRPVQMALAMNATEVSFYVPAQITLFGFSVTLALWVAFWFGFVVRKRRLLLFFVWYLLCLSFLLRHQHGFFPVISPSRYFVYVAPVVGVVFCTVAVTLCLRVARRLRLRPFARELLLVGGFTLLCLSNLVAARLASWRGKLVNTYYVYEDLRVAYQVKESLRATLGGSRPAALDLAVEGVLPLPLATLNETNLPYANPARYDQLRIAFRQALGGAGVGRLQINERADPGTSHRYVLDGPHLLGSKGERVDAFGKLLDEGVAWMVAGENRRAIQLLQRAARVRPFLLNYCLSPGLRLEDVRWLTHGEEFREWLRRIHVRWFLKTEKFERIRSVMEEDLSEYTLCLFYLSYLEAEEGHQERSRYWISQMDYLDRDREGLISWISQRPAVQRDQGLRIFLERFRDGTPFESSLPWRKDDHGFERFLARLLFQRDSLSRR